MSNFQQPFNFKLGGTTPAPIESSPLGRGPLVPACSRNRETPGDPYPDAFWLPSLPLPLVMRLGRFRRRAPAFPSTIPLPSQPPARENLDGFALPRLPLPLLMRRMGRLRRRVGMACPLPSQPPTRYSLTGITRDSAGSPLGLCAVYLFKTATNTLVAATTSDADGNYSFVSDISPTETHFVVSYKTGAPDVAGTTVNTLVGI